MPTIKNAANVDGQPDLTLDPDPLGTGAEEASHIWVCVTNANPNGVFPGLGSVVKDYPVGTTEIVLTDAEAPAGKWICWVGANAARDLATGDVKVGPISKALQVPSPEVRGSADFVDEDGTLVSAYDGAAVGGAFSFFTVSAPQPEPTIQGNELAGAASPDAYLTQAIAHAPAVGTGFRAAVRYKNVAGSPASPKVGPAILRTGNAGGYRAEASNDAIKLFNITGEVQLAFTGDGVTIGNDVPFWVGIEVTTDGTNRTLRALILADAAGEPDWATVLAATAPTVNNDHASGSQAGPFLSDATSRVDKWRMASFTPAA